MTIDKGIYPVWHDFSLELTHPIKLESGGIFLLQGDNGTGKSSFISQILIPAIDKDVEEHYLLWLQQQMLRQFYVVKAHAALNKYPVAIRSEKDAGTYLIHDLEQSVLGEARPIIAVLDEALYPDKLISRIRAMGQPLLAVFCSHNPVNIAGMRIIRFEKVSPTMSRIYEIIV